MTFSHFCTSQLVLLLLLPLSGYAQSSPLAQQEDIEIQRVGTVQIEAVRLAYDPTTSELYYNTLNGDVWRIDTNTGAQAMVYSNWDHGASNVQGFAIGPDGHMYLVGNARNGTMTEGVIVRGERLVEGSDERQFVELARTEPYYFTSFFDHFFNGITLSPDGASIFVNSGSNTDHGENQSIAQDVPDVREMPITTKILRLPADGENILVPNDETALREAGYVYSDGLRNSFDLALNGRGELFASENSGDRDDPEEINWIREDHHYGFPWRMGTTDTPQQFAGYDPDNDPFIDPASWAARSGFFYNDPSYPAVPDGVTFTDPIVNLGPDGDAFRDETDGLVKDASDLGLTISSLTPHRSPLGLVFDTEYVLAEPYNGDGFVTSWTPLNSSLLARFGDESEDVLHLEMMLNEEGTNFEMNVTRVITGFQQPVDMVFIGTAMYVLENNGNEAMLPGLWKVQFPEADIISSVDDDTVPGAFFTMESYPNPVSNRLYLRYVLNKSQYLEVEVFDILGRKQAQVVSGWYNEGQYEIPLAMDGFEQGIYLVRATSDMGGTH